MCVFLYNEIGSFFVVAGNFHYDQKKKIHYDRKNKRYSRLSDGCAVLAITTQKKRYSRLSGGLCCCISFWFWREIIIFVVVAGNFTWRNPSGWPAHIGLTWRNPVRVASPHRINLEEPVRVASPHMINLEEPVRVASTHRINLEEPGQGGQPT